MSVEKALSRPGLVLLLLLAIAPIYFPLMVQYEGTLFPVTGYVSCDPEVGSDGILKTEDDGDKDCPLEAEYPILVSEQSVVTPEGLIAVDVILRFEKLRQCEFIRVMSEDGKTVISHNLTWYNSQGRRLLVSFSPAASAFAGSRPVGDQFVGPWRIFGISTLKGSYAIVEHDCHPFWNTFTKFFP